jgi:hypothetical protein
MRSTAALALTTLGLFVAARTEATSLFGVNLTASDDTGVQNRVLSSPTGVPFSVVNQGNGQAAGGAQPGSLAASAVADAPPGGRASGQVTASFQFDDLTFSGPEATVTTRENLMINGQVFLGSLPDSSGATVVVHILFTPPGGSTRLFVGCTGAPPVAGSNGGDCAAGFPFTLDFSNIDHAMIATPFFTVPTGVPIITEWSIDANAFGSAAAEFEDTMSFPPSGPVFDLPAGFTVDSSEGRIQDNQWLGVPVPEPETSWLVALGGACLLGGQRHATRRTSLPC